MGGEIVVDAGRSRSTCLRRDAYIHDHCLEYFHNYALFYQLPNSNLFTTVCYVFEREASSENYGPWVYFYHILKSKNTLLQFYFLSFILQFTFLSITIRINPCKLPPRGLTTLLFALGASIYFCVCRCC